MEDVFDLALPVTCWALPQPLWTNPRRGKAFIFNLAKEMVLSSHVGALTSSVKGLKVASNVGLIGHGDPCTVPGSSNDPPSELWAGINSFQLNPTPSQTFLETNSSWHSSLAMAR